MFGNNPKRPIEIGDGKRLYVQDIFSTIQGEGPLSGTPAVFLRLGGCNLSCTFCDTEFESFRSMGVLNIISSIKDLASSKNGELTTKLVVVSGGEPMRQPIELICSILLDEGFNVQIETNGTLFRDLPNEVDIVCSPKNAGNGYFQIRPDLMRRISALKFLISKSDKNYSSVPEVGQQDYNTPIYIQPMDERDEIKNLENREFCVELAQRYGYKLSLQIHKILKIA